MNPGMRQQVGDGVEGEVGEMWRAETSSGKVPSLQPQLAKRCPHTSKQNTVGS